MGAGDMPPVVAPELQGMNIPQAAPANPAQQRIPAHGSQPPGLPPQQGAAGTAPLTERDIAKQAAQYTHAGMLSAEQIISGEADRYQFLEPKLLEVISWVQQALVQAERSEDLAKARTDPSLRREISEEIDRLALSYMLKERGIRGDDGKVLIAMVINEIVGLGPLEPLWQDPEITEVICNGPQSVYVERAGRLMHARACRFRSQEHLLEVCQRILAPLNRKVDVRDPLADGRLPDGSRVNVVHHTIAPKGPLLTIRRFPEQNRSLEDLVKLGSMDEEMAALVATLIANKSSTLVVGGTGSGKALDIETPIPTSAGFKRMGDIVVGDEVFDELGKPTLVVGAYDVELYKDCFEVQFSDGTAIVADAEHLWATITQEELATRTSLTPHQSVFPCDMSLAGEMLSAISGIPGDAMITRQEALTLLQRNKFDNASYSGVLSELFGGQKEEEVEKRVTLASNMRKHIQEFTGRQKSRMVAENLGWDGNYEVRSTKEILATLTAPDGSPNHAIRLSPQGVSHPVRDLPVPPALFGAFVAARSMKNTNISTSYMNSSDVADLYTLDLISLDEEKNTCDLSERCRQTLKEIESNGERVIPDIYLFSSKTQRLALLSGILSQVSPRYSVDSKNIEMRSIDRKFLEEVASLSASLGRKINIADIPGGGAQLLISTVVENENYLWIMDIKPTTSRPVRCIRVANESHLFLAGRQFIPTHNTTLLNALSAAIPRHERVITIEDSLELRLHPESHVAAMEARPSDATGGNSVTIRHLVKNALRMRPDRIIVGEIRDAAALDMLQACNTGHEGSMSTVHANGPDEAISRLTVMVAQGGEIPASKVEWLIGSALDLIIIAKRFEDGSRRVAGLYEVPNVNNLAPGESLRTIPLWEWEQTGVDKKGKAEGRYVKRNDISESLRKERGLDHGKVYTWEDVVALGADKPGGQGQAAQPPGKPLPPRPSVSRAR